MKDSYLVSYELDYRLRQYEACIRGYQKCLECMRDNMKKARERRVYQQLTDDHYYWHFNNINTWHNMAMGWYRTAQCHKQAIVFMCESKHFDTEADKLYA